MILLRTLELMLNKNIIRVFPRRTSFTPTDDMAFIGDPPMIRPEAKEVRVSVTFTWDMPEAYRLALAWQQYYPDVKIGGPAYDIEQMNFSLPGMYVKDNVIFTSKGCNKSCPWCLVPLREGSFRSLFNSLIPLPKHCIVQDNNILQHEPDRLGYIFNKLRDCRSVELGGGIDATLVNERFAYLVQSIKLKQLFLACDTEAALKPLEKAVAILKELTPRQRRCYVLAAFNGSTIESIEKRCKQILNLGCFPFVQLYQPPDKEIKYSKEWKQLQRRWSRPAIIQSFVPEFVE